MKDKVLKLFGKYKKWVYVAAAVILILLICLIFHSCKKEKAEPEINVPVYSFDTSFETRKQADNDLKKQGIIIKDRPFQKITKTEAEGDKIAEDFAAENHADYIVKEKNDIPQIIENTEPENKDKSRAENKPEETKIYTNNYYAVSQEKKHDIKAGIAVIDNHADAVLTYRNRDVSYSLYTDGNKDKIIKGAAVQVTIAKW
ncbi:hypothetical protein [Mitsuokella multacida]|uniref:hypothetical protein n=1 Tax=Mitsuokella multacida TaxID=52226 RepID=UPI00241CD957|nr:hypothetical protein [Mitsuokella multacida]